MSKDEMLIINRPQSNHLAAGKMKEGDSSPKRKLADSNDHEDSKKSKALKTSDDCSTSEPSSSSSESDKTNLRRENEFINGNDCIKYPIANRGDYTQASAKPLFLQVLKDALGGLYAKGVIRENICEKTLTFWADYISNCYLADTRQFHSFGHVMKLCEKSTPLQKIATLFHDVAYFQVDGGPPPSSERFLDDVLQLDPYEPGEHIYVVNGNGEEDIGVLIAMKVFDVKMGQKLDPTIGLNEFASAVIASRLLVQEEGIPLGAVADVCAVIEATIPFRNNQWTERLRSNLLMVNKEFKMNRKGEDIDAGVCAAVNLANRDVGDFGEPEELLFLDGTWDLLVENNPRLRLEGDKCPIRVWRCALQKTHTFLCTVATNLIFSKFRDTPSQEYVDWLSGNARRNVEVSRVYTGVKYVTTLLLESLETIKGKVSEPACTKPLVREECQGVLEKDASSNSKARVAGAISMKKVTRAFRLHRTMKDSRIDQNFSHLGEQLIHSLDEDLEKVDQCLDGVKSKLTSQNQPLSKEEALAISKQFPACYVKAVREAFNL